MNITDINLIYADTDIKEETSIEPAPRQPLRQCSIDKVIDVLNIHHRTTTANIVKQSGMCIGTVNRVVYHLLANENITVDTDSDGRHITLLAGYTKNKNKERQLAELEAKKAIDNKMADEYLAGGITMTQLSEKYQMNISLVHKKISVRRGFNKNPVKSKYTPAMKKEIFELSESEKASAVAKILGYPISTVIAMIAKHKTQHKLG